MSLGRVLVLAFVLFYAASLARMWARAWFRPAEFQLTTEKTGRLADYVAPLGWLRDRPQTWLWLHRVVVTLGLLLALLAGGVLVLQLLGRLPAA